VTCSFCKDLSLIQTDAAVGNSPLWFGEWSLSTEFNATDDFLSQWADAQKLAYSQGAGWIVRVPIILLIEALLKEDNLVLELQD
jgi:hypothetical protein